VEKGRLKDSGCMSSMTTDWLAAGALPRMARARVAQRQTHLPSCHRRRRRRSSSSSLSSASSRYYCSAERPPRPETPTSSLLAVAHGSNCRRRRHIRPLILDLLAPDPTATTGPATSRPRLGDSPYLVSPCQPSRIKVASLANLPYRRNSSKLPR